MESIKTNKIIHLFIRPLLLYFSQTFHPFIRPFTPDRTRPTKQMEEKSSFYS